MNQYLFLHPSHPMQKRYEALRAAYVDKLSNKEVASRFGYTLYSFKSIKRDSKNYSGLDFFKDLKKGPKGRRQNTLTVKDRIIDLRKHNFSVTEIEEKLLNEGSVLSAVSINKILTEAGFTKLFRRTNLELLEALQSDKRYPEYSDTAK